MFNQQGTAPGLDGPSGPVSTGTVHPMTAGTQAAPGPLTASDPRAPNWPTVPVGPPSPHPQPGFGYPGGWPSAAAQPATQPATPNAAHGSLGGGFGGTPAWHDIVGQERANMETRTAAGAPPNTSPPNFPDAGLNATGAQPPRGGSPSPASLANAVRAAGSAQAGSARMV